MQSCLSRIQTQESKLSEKEAIIARYVLDNFREVLNLTITELSDRTKSSDATVVRFCKSIGYKGYQDFKINLAQDVVSPLSQYSSSMSDNDDIQTIVSKTFKAEISVLEETLLMLDFKVINKVVELLQSKDRIYIFGSGGSAYIALDFVHKMLKVGVECVFNLDSDTQIMQASILKNEDIVMAISQSGSNKSTIESVDMAKKNGATVIGITVAGKSPMARICDYVLYTSTKELIFKSESVSARTAQLVVLDSIVTAMALRSTERSKNAIQRTRLATANRKY